MKKIGIVVLNYLNYEETIDCVESILSQIGCEFRIVVVDNGSDNESFEVLSKRYRSEKKVFVIHANKNYGFAKGHNIGIHYIRKHFDAEYVVLLNSDTVLGETDYLVKMLQADEEGVGVLGSKILMRNGEEQKRFLGYVDFPATLFYYLHINLSRYGFLELADCFMKITRKYGCQEVLHGSIFMLTPVFFQFYNGLCEKTFLYCEEELLYLYCKKCGLAQKKVEKTFLIHKGGQSAKLFFESGNFISKKDFYRVKSYKYVLLESLKCYFARNKNSSVYRGYKND